MIHEAPGRTRVVNCRRERYDVYCGRGTMWGNPFVIGKDGDRAEVIKLFCVWLAERPILQDAARVHLRGKVLGCHCAPLPCHCDVWARVADGGAP